MRTPFTRSQAALLLMPAALLAAAPQDPQPFEDETYQGESAERYAMVRALEGDVRVRKGELEEGLTRGTPIAEGDVVESRGRGVLQLGDGTRIAFGESTRFTVAGLFTDEKGEKQVLIRLDQGRLRVTLGGQGIARFRVDTPAGSATCLDKGAFRVEVEGDRSVRLSVFSGRLSFANTRSEGSILAGERLTVFSPQDLLNRVRSFNTFDGDAFDRWSEQASTLRRGESWDRVPEEIRYYADDLDRTGHWINTPEFGWVWQPNGVAEDWRPYYRGRWAAYPGGMTWVSDEPWAYVAYHHGRWHWAVGIGWYWIPGVYYSPAWVAWNQTPGYYGWAPLGVHNTPCHWGYGPWAGGYAWNIVAAVDINLGNVHLRIQTGAPLLRGFVVGRDPRAHWHYAPLLVTHAEFRRGRFEHAFRPEVRRERMVVYERTAAVTGRVVLRRELHPGAPRPVVPGRVVFEDRRPRPVAPTPAPRPMPAPRERPHEPRPSAAAPRPELPREARPAPRADAPREVRPAPRPEPPREVRPESRQEAPREARPAPRPDAPRETRPAPRPEPTPREARPAPRPEAPRETRPAPRPETPREAKPAPREIHPAKPEAPKEERH